MTELDILIIGGGPAGLLLASSLPTNQRIGLVERGVLGRTTKFWVTTERRLVKHKLGGAIRYKPPCMTAGSFLGSHLICTGDLAVVDEPTFLTTLINRCKESGVLLSEKNQLISLAWKRDHICVDTTSGKFCARALVDATGGLSPIASTFRLHKLDGFFLVYGAHVQPIRLHSTNIILAYVNQLGDPPPILEIIPTSDNSAYCAIFVYSKTLLPPHSLAALFAHDCAHNPFFTVCSDSKYTVGKVGAIPIGQLRYRKLPGVISVGEAAMIHPPLLATAFNEILEYCDEIALFISKTMQSSDSIPDFSGYHYPLMKRVQDRLQLAMVRWLLSRNTEAFDLLIRHISSLPQETIFNLCSSELDWSELLQTICRLSISLLKRNKALVSLDS